MQYEEHRTLYTVDTWWNEIREKYIVICNILSGMTVLNLDAWEVGVLSLSLRQSIVYEFV
jgi:hypothetical protein